MIVRRLVLPSVVAVSALILSACGSDHGTNPSMAGNTVSATGDANDADVQFAQGMIPHHEQAVEMSEIALDPASGASDEVKALATRIQGAQDPEIQQMTAWLTAWGMPMNMDTTAGHDMSSMEGMMSAEEMDALAGVTGTEFDTMWMQMMIAHHRGAIAMAQEVKASGTNPDVLTLADAIIAAQQAEIDEMSAIIG